MSSLGDKTLATTKKSGYTATIWSATGSPNEAISATLINNFLKLLEISKNAEKV